MTAALWLALCVAAAGYLVGTGRRCRRATAVGLAGVGLLALIPLPAVAGWSWAHAAERAGVADPVACQRAGLWVVAVSSAAGKGLLIAAVLVGRRPTGEADG